MGFPSIAWRCAIHGNGIELIPLLKSGAFSNEYEKKINYLFLLAKKLNDNVAALAIAGKIQHQSKILSIQSLAALGVPIKLSAEVKLKPEEYHKILKGSIEGKYYSQSRQIFDFMQFINYAKSEETYLLMIKIAESYEEIEKLCELMKQNGISPSIQLNECLFKAYLRLDKLSPALIMYELVRSQTSRNIGQILYRMSSRLVGYGIKVKDWSLVNKFIDQTRNLNLFTTTFIFNASLLSLIHTNKPPINDILSKFEKIKLEGAQPNIHSYNIVFRHYKNENIPLFQELKSKGLIPTKSTYQLLIKNLLPTDPKSATSISEEMKQNT